MGQERAEGRVAAYSSTGRESLRGGSSTPAAGMQTISRIQASAQQRRTGRRNPAEAAGEPATAGHLTVTLAAKPIAADELSADYPDESDCVCQSRRDRARQSRRAEATQPWHLLAPSRLAAYDGRGRSSCTPGRRATTTFLCVAQRGIRGWLDRRLRCWNPMC